MKVKIKVTTAKKREIIYWRNVNLESAITFLSFKVF